MLADDTIAAIATTTGDGALAVIRISGPASRSVLERIFDRPGKKRLITRHLHFGYVVDDSGQILDEAMACYLSPPHTYTREPSAEIHCHGGEMTPRAILDRVISAGARLAEPGEFTLRAVVNGRIDLTQAEAIPDVIRAQTEAGRRAAIAGLTGGISREVAAIRAPLLAMLAEATAAIDFPDDVRLEPATALLDEVMVRLDDLLETSRRGALYRNGARVVLFGPPNAGKSSLLNALLRRERAIVSPRPGTTRDTIEEVADFLGIPVVLVDTAGIRSSVDDLEELGIARTSDALRGADLAVLVLDCMACDTDRLAEIQRQLVRSPDLIVVNKIDLDGGSEIVGDIGRRFGVPILAASALTGAGVDHVVAGIAERLGGGRVLGSDVAILTNERHVQAVRRTREAVMELSVLSNGSPLDLRCAILRDAVDALGEVTGESVDADVLREIFSRFCLGK